MRYSSNMWGKSRYIFVAAALASMLLPAGIASAQSASPTDLITKIESYILNPILLVIFAAGFFMFMWGLFEFVVNSSNNSSEAVADGKRHMIYGTLGMFIMVSVYGILSLLNSTFGLSALSSQSPDTNPNTPTVTF